MSGYLTVEPEPFGVCRYCFRTDTGGRGYCAGCGARFKQLPGHQLRLRPFPRRKIARPYEYQPRG